jgi:ribosome-associated protein
LARSIVNSLEDKKGEKIVLMDIQNVSSFADYFVLCNGTSDRMLSSLADSVAETVKKNTKSTLKKKATQRPAGWSVIAVMWLCTCFHQNNAIITS